MKVAVGEGLSTACGVNRQHIMIFLGLQDAYGQKKKPRTIQAQRLILRCTGGRSGSFCLWQQT